jgi:hypothetical protein
LYLIFISLVHDDKEPRAEVERLLREKRAEREAQVPAGAAQSD